MAERVSSLLKLKICMKSAGSPRFMSAYSYTFSSVWLACNGPGPAAAANLGNVEILIDPPAKAAVQGGMVVRRAAGLARAGRLVTISASLQSAVSL
jgi:hypothetical protein